MLNLELVTPERRVFAEPAKSVSLPTPDGEITVLPGHRPLVTAIAPGIARAIFVGREEELAVAGGFAEVRADGTVTIVADSAERADELDLRKVEEAKRLAQEMLSQGRHIDDVAEAAAVAGLERELARLRIIERHRHRPARQHGLGDNAS